jgi:type IV pilus assembly protein PilQ
MGIHLNEQRQSARPVRPILSAGLLTALLLGCSSVALAVPIPTDGPEPDAEPVAAAEAPLPHEIRAVRLSPADEGYRLEVAATGPLTWTSYRDENGDLVVELPNTYPGVGVAELELREGMVESASVLHERDAERDLTKLLIRTAVASEHSVATEGEMLTIGLVAVEPWEPAPEATAELAAPAGGEVDEIVEAAAFRSVGTPEQPQLGPAPRGVPATQLQGVDVTTDEDTTMVWISGDGSFYYSTFGLQDPHRFVVDLIGVVNTSPVSNITVQGALVDGVRVAQFKPQPELVSRVVIDLVNIVPPEIETTPDGLRLTFMSQQAPMSGYETEVAEAPAEEEFGEMAAEPAVAENVLEGSMPLEGPASGDEPEFVTASTATEEPIFEVAAEDLGEEVLPEQEDPEEAVLEELSAVGREEETGVGQQVSDVVAFGDGAEIAEGAVIGAGAAVEELAEEPAFAEPMLEEATSEQTEAVVEQPVYEQPVYEQPVYEEPVYEEPVYDEPAEEPIHEEPVIEQAALDYEDPGAEPDYGLPREEATVAVLQEEEAAQEAEPSEASLFEFAEIDLGSDQEAEEGDEPFATRELTAPVQTTSYSGEPMTMSLRDADIKDVLRSFAQISGLNIVVQPQVSGTVTVELTNVPWDQALDQILKINGLDYQLEGNIMRVAPRQLLQREAQQKAELEAAKALSIPLQTIMRRVSYAAANEIAGILRGGGATGIMSQRGSVIVDPRTNTLIIKELPSHIDTVIAVIENLDIPEPQVMIEARIIETTKRFSSTLGIRWGFSAIVDPALGNTTDLQFPNQGTVDGGVNLLTGGSNALLNVSLGNVLNSFTLDATLQAAENEGLINILSAPKITTLNNERASIQSGLQIPIQTVANNTVSVQFVNATLRLDVTPHVTAEGTVLMDIDIQKREPQLAFAVVGASNAPIATKDASTRVIVRDGGTTVIGGIYKVTSDQGEDRVPGLSNIPILKHLFKNKRRNDENEELLIFITPRVIKL